MSKQAEDVLDKIIAIWNTENKGSSIRHPMWNDARGAFIMAYDLQQEKINKLKEEVREYKLLYHSYEE